MRAGHPPASERISIQARAKSRLSGSAPGASMRTSSAPPTSEQPALRSRPSSRSRSFGQQRLRPGRRHRGASRRRRRRRSRPDARGRPPDRRGGAGRPRRVCRSIRRRQRSSSRPSVKRSPRAARPKASMSPARSDPPAATSSSTRRLQARALEQDGLLRQPFDPGPRADAQRDIHLGAGAVAAVDLLGRLRRQQLPRPGGRIDARCASRSPPARPPEVVIRMAWAMSSGSDRGNSARQGSCWNRCASRVTPSTLLEAEFQRAVATLPMRRAHAAASESEQPHRSNAADAGKASRH